MLRGDGEALAHRLTRDVLLLDQRGLLHHLARIAQKLRALGREQNAAGLAHEDCRRDLLLQLPDGRGQAGLGDEQRLGRLGNRSLLRHLDDVFELLKRHARSLPAVIASL